MSWRDALLRRRKDPDEERLANAKSIFEDVRIEEISLCDDGDNRGASVLFWKRSGDEQGRFDMIVDEELRKAEMLRDEAQRVALAGAVFEAVGALQDRSDDGALKAAILAAIQKWAAAHERTPPPAGDGPPVTEKRRSMYFTKRSEVVEEATRRARVLMAGDPDRFPNEATARAHVWGSDDALVKAYYETPEHVEPDTEPDIIAKTASESDAFAELNAEAQRLVRESGYTLSESEARTRVADARPDLVAKHRQQQRSR